MNPAVPGPIPRHRGTLLHRQVFIVLRDQIASGVYPEGAAIPTEDDLCRLFGVSRITVRRAVADLEQLALVRKEPGRGTFVLKASQPIRAPATLGYIEALKQQSRESSVKVLVVEHRIAPPLVAAQLALAGDEPAVHAVRLRCAKGRPLLVTDVWLPQAIGRHVTRAELKKRPLFEILLAEGLRFGRVVQEVTAVAADPNLAGLLLTEIGAPLLRICRLVHDEQQRAVQHMTIHVSPERSRMMMVLPSSAIDTLSAGQITHDV